MLIPKESKAMSIFLNYRRTDAPFAVDQIYSWLTAAFGRESVFRDVHIAAGANFADAIREALQQSQVILTVIGPNWDPPRLREKEDWVRFEIEESMRLKLNVIPVLLGESARMPSQKELPESIQQLALLHAIPVCPDRRFSTDMRDLVLMLSDQVDSRPRLIGPWATTPPLPFFHCP